MSVSALHFKSTARLAILLLLLGLIASSTSATRDESQEQKYHDARRKLKGKKTNTNPPPTTPAPVSAPAPTAEEPITPTTTTTTSSSGTCSNHPPSTCRSAADCPKQCDSKSDPVVQGNTCTNHDQCPPNKGKCAEVLSATCIFTETATPPPPPPPPPPAPPTSAPVEPATSSPTASPTKSPTKAPTKSPTASPVTFDNCSPSPCQHNAECVDLVDDFRCICEGDALGYSGKTCDVNIDDCASEPCLNQGTCVDEVNSHICVCPTGFSGALCEIPDSTPTPTPMPTLAPVDPPTSAPTTSSPTNRPTPSPVALPALSYPSLAAPESEIAPFTGISGYFFDTTSVSYYKTVKIHSLRFRPSFGISGSCRLHTIAPSVGLSAKDHHSSPARWTQVHNTASDTTIDGGGTVEITLTTPLEIGPSETRPFHLFCRDGVNSQKLDTDPSKAFTELVSDDSLKISNSLAVPVEFGALDSSYGSYNPDGLVLAYTTIEEPLPLCPSQDDSRYTVCVDAEVPPGTDSTWTRALGKARGRWEQIIVGDLPSVSSSLVRDPNPDYICSNGANTPATIDDIYICGKTKPNDGVGKTLGFATYRYMRPASQGGLPITGYMEFDSADVNNMINNGQWDSVILHEIAHIFGVGPRWNYLGLVDSTKQEFIGTHACAAWQLLTGCSSCPPIENQGGAGTIGLHWNEGSGEVDANGYLTQDTHISGKSLEHELMSGYAEYGVRMPISNITVASIQDLGYVVDYSNADVYENHPTCRRRTLRGERTSKDNIRYLESNKAKGKKPKLSDKGEKDSKQKGKQILAQDRKKCKAKKSTAGGLELNCGEELSLAYMENDVIFFMDIRCADSGEICHSDDDCCSDKCNRKDGLCEAIL